MIALIARHLLSRRCDATSMTIGTSARWSHGRPDSVPRRRRPARSLLTTRRIEEDDEFALGRLREAIAQCGFTEIVFEYEPVAAAYSYEQTLDRDELILIGDFGGGTSDFSILRVGPAAAAPRAHARVSRHRRRRRRRRRVRQADHPQAGRAAAGAGVRILLAAGQVPADSELALRAARALAPPVVSEYGEESRDAGAPAAQRAHSRAARGVRAPHQERAGIPAARGGPPHEVRAVDADRSAVRVSLRAGVDCEDGDAARVREVDRSPSCSGSPAASTAC